MNIVKIDSFEDFIQGQTNKDVYETEGFKIIDWIDEVRKDTETTIFIAGGFVRRILLKEKLETDIDLFFKTKEEFDTVYSYFEKNEKCNKIRKTDTNITYIVEINNSKYKIQLININYFNSIEEVLDSFDFTICMVGLDNKNDLYAGIRSLWDISRKRLVVNHITYAISSIRRLYKYGNQGYTFCSGTIHSILQEVVNDPRIIRPEVISVD